MTRGTTGLYQQVERLERAEALDDPAAALQEAIAVVVKPGPFKDVLSGTWLGHPVHPLLVTLPIGSWAGATVLDLTAGAGGRDAADRLVGLGVLTALPTALAGASDWLDTAGGERRVGLVHAVGNYVAVGLMGASWLARKRGRRGTGVLLGLSANAVVLVTGYLGGHMSYSQGVGVDTTAFDSGPQDWTAVADEADLPVGEPVAVVADRTTLLLVRQEDRVAVLAARCTHRGGPLQEGAVADGCVTCPWHGSVFRLADGHVVRGPAVQPQPVYESRSRDGRVEVRRAEPKGQRRNAI